MAISGLTDEIRNEIRTAGPMLFSRFMALALYHPSDGYYSQCFERVGPEGDFITSVSSSELFGQLLAERVRSSLVDRELSAPGGLELVEAGAHDGRLARDILSYFAQFYPREYEKLRYLVVEPLERRQSVQEKLLEPHLSVVSWTRSWESIPEHSINGCIFSNELLDAFPVERTFWHPPSGSWHPWRVETDSDTFRWSQDLESPIPLDVRQLTDATPEPLRPHLPAGFTTEVHSAACQWWREAAKRLGKGYLIAFDYGLKQEEFFAPHRHEGTLRAYYKQRQSSDILARPGLQDITAHVNFSAIETAGQEAGLTTCELQSQEAFLMRTLQELITHQPKSPLLMPEKLKTFQTLAHPSHFGRSFSVLTQQRT